MKEGWERHKEVILLTKDDIQNMIKRYDSSLEFERYELLSGGLSHTNYKVFHQASTKPLVVRIAKDKQNILMEYNIHLLLSSNETIPKFYKVGEYKDLFFGVMEWKEGTLLKDKLFTYSPQEAFHAGYSLGRELGKLSEYHFDKAGDLDSELNVTGSFVLSPEGFLNTMRYFLFEGKVSQWLDGVAPQELMDFSTGYAQLFSLDDSGPRLVHGDFNGLNILMDGSEVSAVLDWEFGLAGSLYMDVGNMLRYEDIPHYRELERGLYEGLTDSGDKLPKEWKWIAKLADLVSLCSMLDNDIGGTNRVRDINRLIHRTVFNEKMI
jgi:serine/threonine protein kinase